MYGGLKGNKWHHTTVCVGKCKCYIINPYNICAKSDVSFNFGSSEKVRQDMCDHL